MTFVKTLLGQSGYDSGVTDLAQTPELKIINT
jgi:hypothetical protein